MMSKKLSDYDVYYKPCKNCGYDTGKSTLLKEKESFKRCWKCGQRVERDFSDRALKNG